MPALITTTPGDGTSPASRLASLGYHKLVLLGNPVHLQLPLTALLCSRQCPAASILPAYDLARSLRDKGTAVISPFHTPIERDMLHFLLRGTQPIVACLGRPLAGARLPAAWRPALDDGRLLVVSACSENVRRTTPETSYQATLLAGALADRIIIVYASPGGKLEAARLELAAWGKRVDLLEQLGHSHPEDSEIAGDAKNTGAYPE